MFTLAPNNLSKCHSNPSSNSLTASNRLVKTPATKTARRLLHTNLKNKSFVCYLWKSYTILWILWIIKRLIAKYLTLWLQICISHVIKTVIHFCYGYPSVNSKLYLSDCIINVVFSYEILWKGTPCETIISHRSMVL